MKAEIDSALAVLIGEPLSQVGHAVDMLTLAAAPGGPHFVVSVGRLSRN